MRLLVLFNLKPGVSAADYEHWAQTRDMPAVRSLPSVDDFRAYRVTGLLGSDTPAPYTASKHAMVGLTRSNAVELGPLLSM
jgi:NAD(P)-dependent dehydrogenase (short-subunit alcohol dehydrogenase family)